MKTMTEPLHIRQGEDRMVVFDFDNAEKKFRDTLDILSAAVSAHSPEHMAHSVMERFVDSLNATGALLYFTDGEGYRLWGWKGVSNTSMYDYLYPNEGFAGRTALYQSPLVFHVHPGREELDICTVGKNIIPDDVVSDAVSGPHQSSILSSVAASSAFMYSFDCETVDIEGETSIVLSDLMTAISVPLVRDQETVGVIECVWDTPCDHSAHDIDFIVSVAEGLGPALFELFELSLKRKEERRGAILGHLATIAFAEPLSAHTLTHFLDEIRSECPAEFVVIEHSTTGDTWGVDFSYLSSGYTSDHTRDAHVSDGVVSYAASECTEEPPPLSAKLVTHLEAEACQMTDDEPMASWLREKTGLPNGAFVSKHPAADVEYIVAALRTEEEGPFHFDELSFLRQAGRIIDRSFRFCEQCETESLISHTLQESLVRPITKIEGLEHAELYHSATDLAFVGGDFYDLFKLPNGDVCFFIGDVSGKGVEAAATSSLAKSALIAYAWNLLSPAHMLSLLNNLIENFAACEDFATVFVAVLDLETGVGKYCSAGHLPIYVRRADNTLETLEATSPLVGAFPDREYRELPFELHPGDDIYLYTDGIIETRSPNGELFGQIRLNDFLLDYNDPECNTWCDRFSEGYREKAQPLARIEHLPSMMIDKLKDFSKGRLSDDIAQLVIRFVDAR